MDESKTAVLVHYASKYYDPQKAHEYYMRTRELKRRSTSTLTDNGKEIWAYTKNSIKEEKSSKVKSEQESRDEKISELRVKADETRENITSRLKELNEALTQLASNKKQSIDDDKESNLDKINENATSQKKQIDSKKSAEIERLMAIEIPTGLSKTERAMRIAERKKKIAKLRSDATADKAKISNKAKTDKAEIKADATNKKSTVSNQTKVDKATNTVNARTERAKVNSDIKEAIGRVREAYKSAKADLDASYEQTYQNEFDKIQSENKKASIKKKISTKKKSHPLSYYIRK